MSLCRLLSRYSGASIQARGRAYAQAGKVINLRLREDGGMSAIVKGSERYAVELRFLGLSKGRAKFYAQCDSPYAESTDYCKHLWAMLLEADQRSYGNSFSQITQAELHSSIDEGMDAEDFNGKYDVLAESL